MPKFALFWGIPYYPLGGMWDFEGVFDSLEDARNASLEMENEDSFEYWYQIVDISTMKVVEAKGNSCYGRPKTLLKHADSN